MEGIMVIVRPKNQNQKEAIVLKEIINENASEEMTLEKEKEETPNNKETTEVEYGVCIDIGTTTIVLYLWDLLQKELIATITATNPQTTYGADVMMRIMHAGRGLAEKLQQMVFDCIEEMLDEIVAKEKLSEWKDANLKKMMIVGNTTMCHLFLGKSVEGLAGAPFTPAYQGNYQCLGKEINWNRFAEATVTVLSGIAAHVGSDALAVAGMLDLGEKNRIELAIDLGTNAEMILNHRGRLFCCSAAAGPALEGKGIACGMRGEEGAIAGVKFAPGTGNMILETIGGAAPKGICGTGLIDLLYELKRNGFISTEGYLLSKEEAEEKNTSTLVECLCRVQEENSFTLFREETGKEIYLEQKGIRQIQLMKGAIYGGIKCLLKQANLELEQIDCLYVAGTFGSNLSLKHAINIGLLPELPIEKISLVGNCAGKGGSKALLSDTFCQKLEKSAKKIEHIELAEDKYFQKEFLRGMNF